jgi:hypothetical protein
MRFQLVKVPTLIQRFASTYLALITLTLLVGSSSVLEGANPLHNAQFLIFRSRGDRLLHKVQFLIFCNPAVDLSILFTISSLLVFLRVLLTFPVLTCRSFFRSRFFRYHGRPPPRFFTPFLPSWHVRILSLSVRSLWIPCSSLALVHLFLMILFLHHATLAQRDTFLQAAANFLWDPQIPRVSTFGSSRRPAARCRHLCSFFIVPENFTAAPSVGTS